MNVFVEVPQAAGPYYTVQLLCSPAKRKWIEELAQKHSSKPCDRAIDTLCKTTRKLRNFRIWSSLMDSAGHLDRARHRPRRDRRHRRHHRSHLQRPRQHVLVRWAKEVHRSSQETRGQWPYRPAATMAMKHEHIQSGTARHLLGFEDEDLGSSPGWWAATVATYCPSRTGELQKFLSSKPCE